MDGPHGHAALEHELLVHGVAHQFDKQARLKRFSYQRKFQFSAHRISLADLKF
jgi:hypothetical protein